MRGKVVVISGGTSGIGEITALALAEKGARLVLIARDRQRADDTLERLRAKTPAGIEHSVHLADISRIDEVKRVAQEIASAEPRIDVLINNAGALFNHRQVTEDGLELTFATNHMSYFVLAHGLRERLVASAPSRIVNTASDAHKGFELNFDDLQSEKSYSGYPVYGRSKLCNILFSGQLARTLAGTGVTSNSLHPGFVATRFAGNSGGGNQLFFRIAKLFAISPQKGAETIIYLASSPEVANTSGLYFYKCKPKLPNKAAQDDDSARRLWSITETLTGIDWRTQRL